MTVESEKDLEGLQRIGRIVGLALKEMKKSVQAGITTEELDQIGGEFLRKHGAHSAPKLVYNFPGETCISVNNEAAHGIPSDRSLQPGDLVNIDVSAELDGYFADTATMVIVEPVSTEKKKLCRCARSALFHATANAKAGSPIQVIGKTIEKEASRCGFKVLKDLGGHGVGRNIHEEPKDISCFYNRFDRRRLTAGMVITIEPFLTTGAEYVVPSVDGWTLRTSDGGLSAQFEHTLVITQGHPIVITAV